MKKIIISALICAMLIFTVCAADKNEIVEKWRELKPSFLEFEPYIEKPISGEGWTAGALKEGFVTDGVNYLNFCRFVAGLEPVTYTDASADSMQKAALLYSAAVFSDTKTIPPYMSKEFYDTAYAALDKSLTSFGFDNLDQSLGGLINSRGINMSNVKPRTTLLNPVGGILSLGFYDGYATVKLESSGEKTDYDFIPWPASGAFPTMLLKENLPWSITLNPKKYSVPDITKVMVRLREPKNNKVIEIKADPKIQYSYYNDDSVYFGSDPGTYTVIFKPDAANVTLWQMYSDFDIHVTLFGIYTADGEETSLEYTVNFFDMAYALLGVYTDADTIASHHKNAIAELSASDIFTGYPDGTFRPHDYITRAEFTAALLRHMDIEPSTDQEVIFSDVTIDHWAKGYIDKAAQLGAVNGTAPGIFSPDEIVTAEQAMKIITIVKGFADRVDVEASGGYPLAYYNLGYELGLMDYVDNNEIFDFQLTRSDTAQIFYNASDITKYWIEKNINGTVLWHRSRSGKAYGYYTFVKFV